MRWNSWWVFFLLWCTACGADIPETLSQADRSGQTTPQSVDALVEIACEPDVQAYLEEFLSSVVANTRVSERPTTVTPIIAALNNATQQSLETVSEPEVLIEDSATLRDIIKSGAWGVNADASSIVFLWRPQLGFRFDVEWDDNGRLVPINVQSLFSESACRDLYQPIHFSACMKESVLSQHLGIELSDFKVDLCRDRGCEFSTRVSFQVEPGTHIESAQLRTSNAYEWTDFSRQGDTFSIEAHYAQHGEFQIYLATLLGTWTGCYSMSEYDGVRLD